MKSITRFFTALKDGFRFTPPGIDRLLADCRSGDGERQYLAMLALSEYYPDASVPALIELLAATAPAVRTRAAVLLGELGTKDRETVGVALTTALNDPEYLVRADAAKSLGKLEYLPAREQIAKILQNDPKWAVRSAAAEALGYFSDPASLTDLEQALQETMPAVRASVVRSLGAMSHTELLPSLQALLDTETNPIVKRELLAAIYRLGERSTIHPLLSMLDSAEDIDEAMQTMQTVQHLVTYKPPARLKSDEGEIWEAVVRATARYTLLSSQARDIEEGLAKLPVQAA